MSARAFTTAEAWAALAGVSAIGAAHARGEKCDEHHTHNVTVRLHELELGWRVAMTAERDDGPLMDRWGGSTSGAALQYATASLSARLT